MEEAARSWERSIDSQAYQQAVGVRNVTVAAMTEVCSIYATRSNRRENHMYFLPYRVVCRLLITRFPFLFLI